MLWALQVCGGKTQPKQTCNLLAAALWRIKHSQGELVFVWAAELLLTVRWKWFSVHATFPALAHLNTWLSQLSAWEVSYYHIVGDGKTKGWVSRGRGQQRVFPMITVQLW